MYAANRDRTMTGLWTGGAWLSAVLARVARRLGVGSSGDGGLDVLLDLASRSIGLVGRCRSFRTGPTRRCGVDRRDRGIPRTFTRHRAGRAKPGEGVRRSLRRRGLLLGVDRRRRPRLTTGCRHCPVHRRVGSRSSTHPGIARWRMVIHARPGATGFVRCSGVIHRSDVQSWLRRCGPRRRYGSRAMRPTAAGWRRCSEPAVASPAASRMCVWPAQRATRTCARRRSTAGGL